MLDNLYLLKQSKDAQPIDIKNPSSKLAVRIQSTMPIKGWPKKLKWSDYKQVAARPKGVEEKLDAFTEAVFRNPPGKKFSVVKSKKGFRLGNINFLVSLDKKKSWVIEGRGSAELLNHEQGHYDIAGLIVRELHKKLEALSEKTPKQLIKRFKEIDSAIKKKGKTTNKRYDSKGETNHGRDKVKQKKWDGLLKSCKADKTKNLPD